MTLRQAIEEAIRVGIDRSNYGDMIPKVSTSAVILLRQHEVKILNDCVMQGDKIIYAVERRFAIRKVNGMYKEFRPKIFVPTEEWREAKRKKEKYWKQLKSLQEAI